jgi:periplasmic divalent cation tolerance protein
LTRFMADYILALSTCPKENALDISKSLVESGKCACVNVIPGVRSVFRWKGNIEVDEECILVIKSEAALEEDIRNLLLSLHPYETPEFIVLKIESGSQPYLEWISTSISAN